MATTTRTTRTSTPTTPIRTPTRPIRASALERVVEPLTLDEFLDEYWEDRPYLASRGESGRFDHLLSLAEVERLVCSGGLRYPAFRLVKEGAKLEVSDYTEDVSWRPAPFTGTANVDRVLAEWEAGATIVLQALHLNWPPLAHFCRDLEAALGHPVQANAYYTPRSAQGLPVHHDTHDVFCLQVAGEKRWLVHEPVLPLPLRDQRYSPELGRPGPPVIDAALRPGDTLYLPRGWLHAAATSETDSLHVTVGVNVYSWLDAFRAALDECAEDVDFRGAAEGDPPPELIDRLADRLSRDDLEGRRRERLVRTRRPIRDGQLRELRALDGLTADSLLERRPTALADVNSRDGEVELAFEGKAVLFPARAREEVEAVAASNGPFRPIELPGQIDEAGRLVLVRRLVREGFLRFSPE